LLVLIFYEKKLLDDEFMVLIEWLTLAKAFHRIDFKTKQWIVFPLSPSAIMHFIRKVNIGLVRFYALKVFSKVLLPSHPCEHLQGVLFSI